ncbi:MAG: hypothetical protein Q9216_005556 [Gyalolechia sp. 2 TL-2023]
MDGLYDPALIPLALPPEGVTANFTDPVSRAWQVYLTSALCLAVTTLFVGLRLYTKFFVIKQGSPDDYATIAAYLAVILYTGLTITCLWNTHMGSDIGRSDQPAAAGKSLLPRLLGRDRTADSLCQILLVNNSLYGPVLFAVKLSLFMLIYSIFGRLQWMRYLVFLGIAVTGLFYLINVIVFPSLCAPRSGQSYAEAAGSPQCQKSVTFSLFSASFNIFTDFYMLFLPIPAVLGLQMPTKKKIGVLAIFGTGLISLARLTKLGWSRPPMSQRMSVPNFHLRMIANIRSLIEMNVGLWVGSMPALAGILRRQSIGFASWMDGIRSRFSSIASLLSPRSAKSGHSESSPKVTASRSTSQEPLGQEQKKYVELQDYQEHKHGSWDRV